VVDQGLHRGAHDVLDVVQGVAETVGAERELRRPGDLLVTDHHGTRLQPVQALLDDVQRLVHLLQPYEVAAVGVGGVGGRDLEVVVLVAAVRLGLAQVVRQPGGAQHRARDAECHAAGQVEIADVDHAGLEGGVSGGELVVLLEVLAELLDRLAYGVHGARGQVLGEAAGADEGVVHAQAGDQLVQIENQLTIAEAVDHHGGGAELHAAGGDGDQVRGEPVELHQQDADDAGPVGDGVLDAEQLLDREAVPGLVEERGQVIHPGDEGGALRPGAVFEVLLDAGVQIADAAAGLGDGFAVDFEDQPQHAVGGGVLRAHVDDDPLVVGLRRLDDLVPVATGDGVDLALGRLTGGCMRSAHQLYDLRWSGAGIWAPLYSTGIPPKG
jgi:hypothetical protein